MNKNAGFTLIEVLIATLVLAAGLLGLAGLQVASLRDNQSAYNRSQATQLTYDIADRIRANPLVAGNYLTTSAATCATKATNDARSMEQSAGVPVTTSAATCTTNDTLFTACTSAATSCTPTQLVVKDLFEWNSALTSSLPGGTGAISLTGAVYTISVKWDDNRDGAVNNSDPNFMMSFQL